MGVTQLKNNRIDNDVKQFLTSLSALIPSPHHRLEDSKSDFLDVGTLFIREFEALQAEVKAARQKASLKGGELERLQVEYEKVKRKLNKRERMIEMALSRLEIVSHRKERVETVDAFLQPC